MTRNSGDSGAERDAAAYVSPQGGDGSGERFDVDGFTSASVDAPQTPPGLLTPDDSEIEAVPDEAREVWTKPEREVVYTREDYERDKKARERREAESAATEREQVVEAAHEWRRIYWAWLQRPLEPRDLEKNGENLALSGLLDALEALDEAEKP